MKDYEVKKFEKEEEVKEILAGRKTNDIWLETKINKLCFIDRESYETNKNCYDVSLTNNEAIQESFNENGYCMVIMTESERDILLPIRYTAVESIYDRAGIAGQTIHLTEETKDLMTTVLSAKEKSGVLTLFCSLYDKTAKVLIRDDKTSFVASGAYAVLDASELFEALKDAVDIEYPENVLNDGFVSHEAIVLNYGYNDPDMEENIKNRLLNFGINVSNVKTGFQFRTSDTGLYSASVNSFFTVNDGIRIPCGEAIISKHMGKNSIKTFTNQIKKMNASFKHSMNLFEKMSQQTIEDPTETLLTVSRSIGLPKKLTKEFTENMNLVSCSAFDIYWTLCQIVNEYGKRNPKNPERVIYFQEMVARSATMNYENM